MKHFIYLLLIFLTYISGCSSSDIRHSRQDSNIDISEGIFLVDGQESRVYAYLESLKAKEIWVEEIFLEESEQYTIGLGIVHSKKLVNKSILETEQIVNRIGKLLISSIDYVAYYRKLQVTIENNPNDNEEKAGGIQSLTFLIEELQQEIHRDSLQEVLPWEEEKEEEFSWDE